MERVKIPNFLIVAIDTELRDYLTEKGVNVYYKDIQVRLLLSPPARHPRVLVWPTQLQRWICGHVPCSSQWVYTAGCRVPITKTLDWRPIIPGSF